MSSVRMSSLITIRKRCGLLRIGTVALQRPPPPPGHLPSLRLRKRSLLMTYIHTRLELSSGLETGLGSFSKNKIEVIENIACSFTAGLEKDIDENK